MKKLVAPLVRQFIGGAHFGIVPQVVCSIGHGHEAEEFASYVKNFTKRLARF
jgi:hypothetical protein